jgi:hypothetical protein
VTVSAVTVSAVSPCCRLASASAALFVAATSAAVLAAAVWAAAFGTAAERVPGASGHELVCSGRICCCCCCCWPDTDLRSCKSSLTGCSTVRPTGSCTQLQNGTGYNVPVSSSQSCR